MKHFIRTIPGKLNSKVVIYAMDLMSRIDFFAAKIRNRKEESVPSHTWSTRGFIENQNGLSHIPFGKKDLAYAGCGVIAVYNLLHAMEMDVSAERIRRTFLRNGIIQKGRFGVSPLSIVRYLRTYFEPVALAWNTKQLERELPFARGMILTVINDRDDITKQIHIFHVEITKDAYILHNSAKGMVVKRKTGSMHTDAAMLLQSGGMKNAGLLLSIII